MSDELLVILARYDGRCGICQRRIVADEHSIVEVDGEWVHADCAEDEGYEVGSLGAADRAARRSVPERTLQLSIGAWSNDA